jgi:hypothetical protein
MEQAERLTSRMLLALRFSLMAWTLLLGAIASVLAAEHGLSDAQLHALRALHIPIIVPGFGPRGFSFDDRQFTAGRIGSGHGYEIHYADAHVRSFEIDVDDGDVRERDVTLDWNAFRHPPVSVNSSLLGPATLHPAPNAAFYTDYIDLARIGYARVHVVFRSSGELSPDDLRNIFASLQLLKS